VAEEFPKDAEIYRERVYDEGYDEDYDEDYDEGY
jgi:hypothetical protein